MADRELVEKITALCVEEHKKPKKDQNPRYLGRLVTLECEDYFRAKVSANLATLFIDGDFARREHTHFIE